MEELRVLCQSDRFRTWLAKMVVGMGLYENCYGKEFNAGVRYGALFLFNALMGDEEIPDGLREDFALACAKVQMKGLGNELQHDASLLYDWQKPEVHA